VVCEGVLGKGLGERRREKGEEEKGEKEERYEV